MRNSESVELNEWMSDDTESEPPRDEPLALDEYGVTGAEESRSEPLSASLRRELPDRARGDDDEDWPGLLVRDDAGVHALRGDPAEVSIEEAAMHVVHRLSPAPAPKLRARPKDGIEDRLELIEAEIDVLLTTARTLVDAVDLLAVGLESAPGDDPAENSRRVSLAAQAAHDLLRGAEELRS